MTDYEDEARLVLKNNRNNTALFREINATPPGEGPEYLGDGDTSNDDRAEWALAGVVGFIEACHTDDENAVADFLTDLMHLLDRMPKRYGTFAENMRRGRANYLAEIERGQGPLGNAQYNEGAGAGSRL